MKELDIVTHNLRSSLGPGTIIDRDHNDIWVVEWTTGPVLRHDENTLTARDERVLTLFDDIYEAVADHVEDGSELHLAGELFAIFDHHLPIWAGND